MKSARLSRLTRIKRKKHNPKKFNRIFIVIALIIICFYFFINRSTHFSGYETLSVVSPTPLGDVLVTTFKKIDGELISIRIPGDTEVDVAHQLGRWRIKSVWQLGVNEGLGGKLLAETVTKNFKFPSMAWTGEQGRGLFEKNLVSKAKMLFQPYDTNLGFGDRVNLLIYSLGVGNLDRKEIDLEKTSYLTKSRLIDGADGFIITGSIPQNLLVVFADYEIARQGIRIILKNSSGISTSSNEIAKVLEVLGGKVVANIEMQPEGKDCDVLAKDNKIAQKISSLFDCNILSANPEGNYDLELRLGKDFIKRF